MVHEKKSINKYPIFFPIFFPLEEMRQKSTKLYVFWKRNCARLSAGRLPHQIASDLDDFCAVLKLSVSAFWKPKCYQNPLRSDRVNKIIEWGLQIPFRIFENGFEMVIFRPKIMFFVFFAEKMGPIGLENVQTKFWKTNFQKKK